MHRLACSKAPWILSARSLLKPAGDFTVIGFDGALDCGFETIILFRQVGGIMGKRNSVCGLFEFFKVLKLI